MAFQSAAICGRDYGLRVLVRLRETMMDSRPRVIGSACGLVLCGILIAGLWPFHSPRNDVAWLEGNGLTFGRHGSIVSSGEFESRESNVDSSCSIELWLRPARVTGSGTILAFYQPNNLRVSLALRQSLGGLLIQVVGQNGGNSPIYVQQVFRAQTPLFITITSGRQGTVAYVDGREYDRFTTYHVREEDLTGKLLVGNTLSGSHEWSGQLLALAVYNQELKPEEILQHYENWMSHKFSAFRNSGHAVAFYPFNEAKGGVAHNQVDAATDLLIPTKFFVVHQKFLSWPWNEFYPGRSYWKNVAINIGGFMPLGFFFCAYFRSARMTSRPTLATVLLGFVVSLSIEISQAFLPTRDSGLTDVITNTVGTAVGTMLYRYETSLPLTRAAKQSENVDSYPPGLMDMQDLMGQDRDNCRARDGESA
jgi:VanZ like family/Concanavalin A-like lectin/glucanases superfamily